MKPTVHLDGLIFALQRHGGISRVFEQLLLAWRSGEQMVTHLHLPAGIDPSPWRKTCDAVMTVPTVRPWRPGALFRGRNARRAREAEARRWSDLAHGVFLSTYYSTHESLRIPQVAVIQDMIYERFPELFPSGQDQRHRDDKARCLKAADVVIFPSCHARDDALDWYGKTVVSKPHVIPYTADPVFYDPPTATVLADWHARWNLDQPYVLMVGNRVAHKNFVTLLAAFARWSERRKFRLVLVGGGPLTPHEASAVEGLGLRDRISVIAAAGSGDLVTAFYAARAVVVTSLSEGYGFPVIEAMAAGIPVASSRGGSLPEVGLDVPYYFDPRDVDALTAALSEAVNTSSDSARLKRGREIARSRTWLDVANEYAAIISEVEHEAR